MAACAFIAGVVGAVLARQGQVELARWGIPSDHEVAFIADAWAHAASYLTRIAGGLVLIGYDAARRYRISIASGQAA
jgi:hypothetical protein